MSRLSGVALVLAGMGVAAYTLSSSNNIAPGTAGPPQPPAPETAQTDAAVTAGQKASGSARKQEGEQSWQTVVEAATPLAKADPRPPPAKIAAPPPAAPMVLPPPRVPMGQATAASGPLLDRAGLTREIQRHLKRVGCYAGDVNGVWTAAMRRSMKAFTDRVNATLPVEEPDYILLAMVQSQQDKACGQGCRAGEGLADDGRCLPKAIVALGTKKQAAPDAPSGLKATATGAASSTHDPAPPPPQGRMALAGPQPAATASATAPLVKPGSKQKGHKADHRGRPARRPVHTYAGNRYAANRDWRRPVRGTSHGMPSWVRIVMF